MRYRNATYTFVGGLRDTLATGQQLTVRGSRVSELRNRVIVIERPDERCIVVPGRQNNIFATIAETMWVLAGRNDLTFLSHYLPRAYEFSDDGQTWRAAYGPRLRNWSGIDQIQENLSLLGHELSTRRAVMSIFDPAIDFVDSKDIPCNNWIHWLARDNRLHMNVAIRSNDIVWGFSGINAFEWSVLHELMAFWLGLEIGEMTFFASSFHLYERHEQRARFIVERFPGITCYEYGIGSPRFKTSWDDFEELVRDWFSLEERARVAPKSIDDAVAKLPDPLLRQFLELIQIYNGFLSGWSLVEIDQRLAGLPETDLTTAAYEFFHRKEWLSPDKIAQPAIARYWVHHAAERPEALTFDLSTFRRAVTELHAEKTASYGASWKRRGELISIMCNIARKVDRLEHTIARGPITHDETVFDTVVDLFVYSLKYQTYLADRESGVAEILFGVDGAGVGPPYSDGLKGFTYLVSRVDLTTMTRRGMTAADAAAQVFAAFSELEACFPAGNNLEPAKTRFGRVKQLTDAIVELISALEREIPGLYRLFIASCLKRSV